MSYGNEDVSQSLVQGGARVPGMGHPRAALGGFPLGLIESIT